MSCKLLSWNINGINKKFQSNEVQALFADYDILAVSETHLNILNKCPKDFILLARSKPIKSTTPRGGVAIYKKITSEFDITVITQHDFNDCVVFKITPIDVICIVLYIPPSNTKYYSSEYMENLQLILSNFKNNPTCLIGDLNSRFGEPPRFDDKIVYKSNPDKVINANGRSLLRILKEEKSYHLLNGLHYENLKSDSDFTFFRGELHSQNDIALTNNLDIISKFLILDKHLLSDHKPISVMFSVRPKTSLEFVASCALDTLKYDHLDINKRVLKTVRLSQLDVLGCINAMDVAAAELKEAIVKESLDNDEICSRITSIIYSSCKSHKKHPRRTKEPMILNKNCTSHHYSAIAEANFKQYNRLLLNGKEQAEYQVYLNTWLEAEELANSNRKEEMNISVNKKWNQHKLNDGKALWNAIDWKGKSIREKTEEIPVNIIHTYFKSIFQSSKTKDNPTLQKDDRYQHNYVEELDQDISLEEMNKAMNEIGTGTGLDGIAPDVLKIVPNSLRCLIHLLYNRIFSSNYPVYWQDQLLLPHPKKGHKPADPQLRGVAIGALLSRLYDKILNQRFKNWYVPNKEQAGFRELMGCLLQIFVIYLLMELATSRGDELFVAFMDYEKAFDYLNRKRLMEKLGEQGAGNRFIQAIHNMYQTTAYIPKVSNSRLGERIFTEHGVTQGKESSANLYSFYVSDMPSYLGQFTGDFMDPLNLVQLADDTATLASLIVSLCQKIKALFNYSADNDQVANIGKTKYLHLSKTPHTEPLQIDEDQYVESAHKKGYVYLGSLFINSNILIDHILANIDNRKGNIHKFYAWLQYNIDTPVKVKLVVLYNCVFSAILYAAETWGDLTKIAEKILLMERQALKRCLGVKSSTPNNILYIELDRGDIVATIKDRQYKFYRKLLSLDEGSAVILDVLELCKELAIVKYYEQLNGSHRTHNLAEKKLSCMNNPGTYSKRYTQLSDLKYCPAIYESYMREDLRIIITRWRMSCFDLAVESGRYEGLAVEDRLCSFCEVIEDEKHAIFDCKAYDSIRSNYKKMLEENPSVKHILNPKSRELADNVGMYLKLIENERKSLI